MKCCVSGLALSELDLIYMVLSELAINRLYVTLSELALIHHWIFKHSYTSVLVMSALALRKLALIRFKEGKGALCVCFVPVIFPQCFVGVLK